jgi:hypothetical protein
VTDTFLVGTKGGKTPWDFVYFAIAVVIDTITHFFGIGMAFGVGVITVTKGCQALFRVCLVACGDEDLCVGGTDDTL